jgi:transposase
MATSLFQVNFPQAESLQQSVNEADYIIGLDLHKKTTAICVIDPRNPNEPVWQRKRLKNIDLMEKINALKGKKFVVAEAAYGWFPLRKALKDFENITFAIFDPRKTSAWIETSGIKNDKIDAQVLAYACLHGGTTRLAVHQPEPEAKENFRLVNLRDKLVQERTRVKNQLKAMDKDYGVNPYTGELSEKSELVKSMEDLLLDQLTFLDGKIQGIEKQMAEIGKYDDVISHLKTIPGIGAITAFALRSKIETLDRFQNAAKLCSYFGFGVRERQSGENMVKGKISKTGNSLIRKLLVQGAQVIRFQCSDLVPLYFPNLGKEELMKDKKHANKVVIGLARKNLCLVYSLWKSDQDFDLDIYRQRKIRFINNIGISPKAADLV